MQTTTSFSKTRSIRPDVIVESKPHVTISLARTEENKSENPERFNNESYGELFICNSGQFMSSKIKQNRTRTSFTYSQIDELTRAFEKACYASKPSRMNLAERTNLTDTQIKTWFGNRRAKLRKQRKSEMKSRQSRSTDAVQYPLNDSLNYSVMNQSMSEPSLQSQQMYKIYQPLIHQFHMQMPHGLDHIQNSTHIYPSHSMASWNPTYNLPALLTSQFCTSFARDESPSDCPPTPSTTNSLPSPMISEFHQSFNREEPSDCIRSPTPSSTVGLNKSENSNDFTPFDTIETTASMPSHNTTVNNNLYSPWSYTSSQPLQHISFSDIQMSSGNQMQYIPSGLSMHHHYPSSFIQQNLPTFSTHSEATNIPQQYLLRH